MRDQLDRLVDEMLRKGIELIPANDVDGVIFDFSTSSIQQLTNLHSQRTFMT